MQIIQKVQRPRAMKESGFSRNREGLVWLEGRQSEGQGGKDSPQG